MEDIKRDTDQRIAVIRGQISALEAIAQDSVRIKK